ncbi:MAG TPA: magnesium chelatase [Thermoanaerobacterales bacterium]|jgi:magnesium chelatase subunit I|nr:magnesium chelatase [Thermoanaerobacterales bacterium]
MKKYNQLIKHSGNAALFDFIELSILGTLVAQPLHLHAEGLRGTGKTTIIRASREILPKIKRIKGCDYNCDPNNPHCPEHKNLTKQEILEIGIEQIDMPFLEISPSAKKGTVVGSIDLKKLTSKRNPEAAILLGTIPKAHRGIIFIDEINRVADMSPEIADVLLDVMGTKPGKIQIEEVGFSPIIIPAQVSIWAASNPDEDPGPLAEIRRQLSDRFDFTVNVERPTDPNIVEMILKKQINPFFDGLETKKRCLFTQVANEINNFTPSDKIKSLLASIYVDFGLESIRGVEAILQGVKFKSAMTNRTSNINDLIFITAHALRHRTDKKNLNDILERLQQLTNKHTDNDVLLKSEKNIIEDVAKKKNTEIDKRQSLSLFEKLSNYFKNRSQSGGTSSSRNGYSKHQNAKDTNLNAPPQKALPISELELKEYVKTDKEL